MSRCVVRAFSRRAMPFTLFGWVPLGYKGMALNHVDNYFSSMCMRRKFSLAYTAELSAGSP